MYNTSPINGVPSQKESLPSQVYGLPAVYNMQLGVGTGDMYVY